jgi:hypothetical protein
MSRLNSILLSWGLANIPISAMSGGLLMRIGVGSPLSVGSTIRRGCYVHGQLRVDFVVLIYFSKGVKDSAHLLRHNRGVFGVNTLVNRVACILHSASQLVVIGSVRGTYTTDPPDFRVEISLR